MGMRTVVSRSLLRVLNGFRPEYFFSGGSIDNNHIAVEKQASASDRRSHNFVGAVLVLNLVSILVGP